MKRYFILLVILISLSLINSAPPVTQVQQFSEGYVLKVPEDFIIKQNTNYSFMIHVFNISNGLPRTSSISCYLHLYDNTGEHIAIIMTNTSEHLFDYEFFIDKYNFTKTGDYYYNVQCNSSSLGGFMASNILVTPSGNDRINTGESIVLTTSLIPMILLLLIFVYISTFFVKPRSKIIFLIISSIIWLIITLYILVNMNYTMYLYEDINNGYVTFFSLLGYFSLPLVFALIFYGLYVSWMLWNIKRGYKE